MGQDVTEELLDELVVGSWAEGTFSLAVAAAIEHGEETLLLGSLDNDFHAIWQLPADLVLPGETLLDALSRVVSLTTGLRVTEVTGYASHHDCLLDGEIVRTFVFSVTVADPKWICRSARVGHQWSSHPINDSLVILDRHRSSPDTTPPRQRGPSPLDQLSAELREQARGLLCAEAAVELLISQQSWLNRREFVDEFVVRANSIDSQPGGSVAMAVVDWARARAALDAGTLSCSSSEGGLLAIAASLGEGIPVDLRDAVTGLDALSTELVRRVISHAADHRP